VRRLKRKYGEDLSGLIHLLDTLSEESGDILEARAEAKKLTGTVAEYREKYLHAARDLSFSRRRAAGELEAAMKEELKDLAMPNALFEVSFRELQEDKGSPGGLEKVEFFLASNPGEAPRPLSRVASGGELSRIMLAVKALQVDGRGSSTVIFDEVDSGIGGHTAFSVGTRLVRVAQRQQVLCVTHLHQIAALADHHLSVHKYEQDGRTHVGVTALDRDARIVELARMLGASPDSASVREHVQRLMEVGSAEASG
jgi:DNA repair protein RecN (Recombination protein N)